MIRKIDDLEDRVFSFYGESQDLAYVRYCCETNEDVSLHLDVADVFDRLELLRGVNVESLVHRIRSEETQIARSLALFFWTYWQTSERLEVEHLTYLRREAAQYLTHVDGLYVEFLRLIALPAGGLEQAERLLSELSSLSSVKADLVQTFVRCWIAVAEKRLDRSEDARRHLELARDMSIERGFLALLMVQWRLASLSWQQGSPGTALELHQDADARSLARRFGKYGWLVQSHSSAAKCALDEQKLDVAREELERAEKLIGLKNAVPHPLAVANSRHVRGEYLWRLGEHDEAKRWVREALRIYREHEEVRGALEANVTLAEFRFETGDYDVVKAHLSGLISAADQSEYRDLRGRLLAIQARLDASDA